MVRNALFRRVELFARRRWYDLGELGRYYGKYRELMEHWNAVLPAGVLHTVQYENVVDTNTKFEATNITAVPDTSAEYSRFFSNTRLEMAKTGIDGGYFNRNRSM